MTLATSTDQLETLRTSHASIRGKPFNHFMCPITLRDEETELQKGHILNDALKIAARSHIVQRKDVDGYFGRTIEPTLIYWLNLDMMSLSEILSRGRRFAVTLPNGTTCEAIPAKAKGVGNRLPKMPVCDKDGTVVGEVYVKTSHDNLVGLHGLKVNLQMSVNDSAIIGSWLKVAYLALFHRCGYQYVYTEAGQYIRAALADFYNSKATKEDAHYYFDRFKGCIHFLAGKQVPHIQNTIEHGTVLVRRADGIIFGVSCLFRVNKILHMVTLPLQADSRRFAVISRYDKLLRNPQMPHDIVGATLGMDGIHMANDSVKFEYEADVQTIRSMLAG